MISRRKLFLSWPFAVKRQFPRKFQILLLKAVDQKCSLVRMLVQSGCFNKGCKVGSTADGVERSEGEEKKSAVSSTCWITGASCHTVRGVQYGLNYVSKIHSIVIYYTIKNHPFQDITGQEH